MIATSIYAKEGGLITGETSLFLYHLLALVIVFVFTFGGAILIYKLTNWIIPMRVTEDHEELGLDISQHLESIDPTIDPFGKLSME